MSTRQPAPAIGIDLGGTYTRAALFGADGDVLSQVRERTIAHASADALYEHLMQTCERVCAAVAATPVGVAIPGTFDEERKCVVRSVSFHALEGRPIAHELTERFGRTVHLFTDAEAATWGEYQALPDPPRRFVHLRIGTGIACGLVLDGGLQRLDAGRTTHLEALVVDRTPSALPCPCGLTGCLETVASGAALTRQTELIGIADGLSGLRAAIRDGRTEAVEILERAARALGTALPNLIAAYEADLICLGGGVADHLPELVEQARLRMQASEPTAQTTIQPARLGDDAGVIGAARLAITCQ